MKKILALVLTLTMVFALSVPAFAADIIESETVVIGGDSIEREDLFISAELAQEITTLFISDMIAIQGNK